MDMHLNMMMRDPERFLSMKTEVYSFALACFVVLTVYSFSIQRSKEPFSERVQRSCAKGEKIRAASKLPFLLVCSYP
jgi:hypothetical protein